MKARIIVGGAVLMLLVAACGNSAENVAERIIEEQTGSDVDISDDGGSVQITDEEGGTIDISSDDESIVITGTDESGDEMSIEMGGTEIPEGFPMPIPDGSEVVLVSSLETPNGASYSVTVEIDPNDAADIVSMYEGWYADQGMDVTSSASMVIGENDSTTSLVQITEFGSYSEVILTWSPTG